MKIDSIGFVGTGAITEAMVRGLLTEPAYASEIHVSPRSAHIAATLADEFAAVRIAKDNQDVVERSGMVFLAIRPQVAEEVVRALSFRDGQMVVSLVAATERQALSEWIGADVHLVQAIPLPFVAGRQGVTAIYPPDTAVAALFDTLGTAVQCQSRKEYDLLAAASAMMSTYFGIMEQVAVWLERSGLEKATGQAYIAPLFASLAQKANSPGNEPFSALSREFATKGGLNEQVFSDFEKKGGLAALAAALDGVLARIEGKN
ncbi:pyrroline-5-carboxylate reductase [Rhizobium leguminosarum]|uniref:Pyrroline-5-carboxylate reductase n=1 Tax=Rhizobium leguminosarum TaxID=384 RepID=A0A6L9TH18_RHILE|nr:pyrroline-5-carboxylate reductase [Rhizobium leguminosarum]MBY5312785.1 NAD(P)-binding domain-containing protein [Rhizobium leguminosarum]NEH48968.1 pyrroline-5-carboxylate reductase [Rhizobium leguminosarum]NEK17826.1 pyrroline-5-carboxylate reductase [Rhizobium leguminosarum]NEK32832.1 pyrroline-5-carboxylate reductase [Rhizobium leguminosarum]